MVDSARRARYASDRRMRWLVKVAAQHALSVVPFAGRAEEVLRRRVTRTTSLGTELFRYRVRWSAGPYLRAIAARFGRERLPELFHLDVGAGWHPIVPLVFRSAGIARQRLVDIEPHLTAAGACEVLAVMSAGAELEWLGSEVPGCRFERIPRPTPPGDRDLGAILGPLGIAYSAPEGSEQLQLPGAAADVVSASGVLAYLRPEALDRTLREMVRVLRPEGLLCLYVHLTDDFSGFDRSLSPFNFLRFDAEIWERLICSRRYYNNRLRMADYLAIFERHGLRPVYLQKDDPTPEDVAGLERLPLARPFAGRDPRELGIRRFLVVLERAR